MQVEGTIEKRLRALQRKKACWKVARRLAITAGTVYLLFGYLFVIAIVHGDSMLPALRESDLTLFFRLSSSYQAGNIVLVRMEEGTEYVKRIVALPGQTVEINEKTGELLIDGEPMSEPYIYEKTYGKARISYPLTLGEDEYFVLGDHRTNSRDSRNYGFVSKEQIDGRMLLVVRWQ